MTFLEKETRTDIFVVRIQSFQIYVIWRDIFFVIYTCLKLDNFHQPPHTQKLEYLFRRIFFLWPLSWFLNLDAKELMYAGIIKVLKIQN